MFDVAHSADDRVGLVVSNDSFSYRIFTGPIPPRQILVNYRDLLTNGLILVRKRSPALERDSQRSEVAGCHQPFLSERKGSARRRGTANDLKYSRTVRATKGNRASQRRRLHSRCVIQAIQQGPVEHGLFLLRWIGLLWKPKRRCHH